MATLKGRGIAGLGRKDRRAMKVGKKVAAVVGMLGCLWQREKEIEAGLGGLSALCLD